MISPVSADPIRVLVCDDSAVIRGMLTRILEEDPAITVVDTAPHGKRAIELIDDGGIEVVVLDVEMPVMDGLVALPKLLAKDPDLKVIMASTLTDRNATISFKALSIGAVDYVPKPSSGRLGGSVDFQRELLEKVRIHGEAYRRARAGTGGERPRARRERAAHEPAPPRTATGAARRARPAAERPPAPASLYPERPIRLRPPAKVPPHVLAIGSSTGGPQALINVLGGLGPKFRFPILVTQHMPPTFTKIFAERLGRAAKLEAQEGIDGEIVSGGRIYVAPGNFHMVVERTERAGVIRITQAAPENFCRPAVDPMLRSLAGVYGNRVLAVIMTGMGKDGAKGSHEVVQAGGSVIAQDETTSVVWGMPGAVATAGLCSAVLQQSEIAPYVLETFGVA